MLPWILGGLIGATVTAVVMYNEEEKEKVELEKEAVDEDLIDPAKKIVNQSIL